MGKPEDISQDVWDEAEYHVTGPRPTRDDEWETVELVARAIMAAEQRGEEHENKACASLAGEYVWDKHALAQATDIGRAVHYQAAEITAAIRNRRNRKGA